MKHKIYMYGFGPEDPEDVSSNGEDGEETISEPIEIYDPTPQSIDF